MTGESDGAATAPDSLVKIDVRLVERLIATQFPYWADLPVRPVLPSGWDNRTFRLGGDMSVRLPSAAPYALAVEKEQRWLPVLAPQLPLPIPVPLGAGVPGEGYPYRWSVYGWRDGAPASVGNIGDLTGFAVSLAGFLTALQQVDPAGGPAPGPHCFHRGGPLRTYDSETRDAIEALGGRIPGDLAMEIWQVALRTSGNGPPVWFHGDIAYGNLLVRDGRLAAVIDFGTSGVGDPACDAAIAWTLFSGESRTAFRTTLGVDAGMWARARGWALWKALITYAYSRVDEPKSVAARSTLDQIFTEYAQSP